MTATATRARTEYDPAVDSSPGTDNLRIPDADLPGLDGLILVHGKHEATGLPLCYCGCFQPVHNAKRMFRQGHDQRLLGKLVRAHLAGVEVHLRDGGSMVSTSAAGVARNLDAAGGGHHWADKLAAATARVRDGKKSKPAATPKSEPADRVRPITVAGRVKIGRWFYDAIQYVTTGEVTYTKKDGSAHQADDKTAATFAAK